MKVSRGNKEPEAAKDLTEAPFKKEGTAKDISDAKAGVCGLMLMLQASGRT